MSTNTTSEADRSDAHSSESDDSEEQTIPNPPELSPDAKLLAEENQRLRAEYARARRATHRRTALWLTFVGLVAVGGGVVFSDGRQILFALGATGLFGGILTYYLTPTQFVPADVGTQVYAAGAANMAALSDELALRDEQYYLPSSDSTPARLFVPQRNEHEFPSDQVGPIITAPEKRGLVLEPTGRGLFMKFERALDGSFPAEPTTIATRLVDGLVEQLTLARRADPDVDTDGGRVTVAVEPSAFGDVDRFDHPIASFLAVGFAEGLDQPVELQVDTGGNGAEWLVTCRWDPDK